MEIKLIPLLTNTGFSKAVNLGISEAKTEYIILLNNDTVVDGNFIQELTNTIEKRKDIFSVSAKMINMNQNDRLDGAGDLYCAFGWGFARGKGKPVHSFNKEGNVFSACAGAAIYRSSILKEIGCFDEEHFAYLEDCDLGYRAQIYGYKNRYQPDAKVFHAGSAVSGSRYNTFKVLLSAQNNVYLLHKNMPIIQYIINLPFLLIGFLIKWVFFISKNLGREFIRGTANGIKLSYSKKGKIHKVSFQMKHLKNYVWIQFQLWKNIFLRLS
jgi:GT2 family glycosyltransferase